MNFENYDDDKFIWDSPAFPQQSNPKEDIILIVRQDIAVLVIRLIATAFLFGAILLIKFLAAFIIPSQLEIIINLINFFVSFAGLVLLLSFLRFLHNFYLSMQLVTNDRVIDIDQRGIFKREVNELAIKNIQDVTYKQNGILQSMLGYGEVIIKTASIELGSTADNTTGGFVFENCPEPSRVAGIINDLYHKYESEHSRQEAITSAEELKKVLSDLGPNQTSGVKEDEIPEAPTDLDMSNFSF